MKLRAIILFLIIASTSVEPLAAFTLNDHTLIECPSNHGDDVPPSHTHTDCSHSIHGFQINFITEDHHLELATEHNVIEHSAYYSAHIPTSFLKSLFKPPRD